MDKDLILRVVTHVSAGIFGASIMFIAFATAYNKSFTVPMGDREAICVVVKK